VVVSNRPDMPMSGWRHPDRCDTRQVRTSYSNGGARLVIRSASWVRFLFWMNICVGIIAALAGLAVLTAKEWYYGVVLLIVGVFILPLGRIGLRNRVECDRNGVLFRAVRSQFVPVSDIAALAVRPVLGLGPDRRALIAVVRTDGSEVRLDPTLVVRSRPDNVALLAQIATMEHALGLAKATDR
jgi:hypothetical protein